MKRSTTNRRPTTSAMLETLESRQLFCFAVMDSYELPASEDQSTQQTAQLRDWSNVESATKTAGPTKTATGGST